MNDYMIQSLDIRKFRGLNSLCIDNLSRINVFVGANNCGKTSVLEAIKILSAPKDIGQLVTVALRRSGANAEQRKKSLVNYLLSVFQQENDREEHKEKTYSLEIGMVTAEHQYEYEANGMIGEVINSAGDRNQTLGISVGISEDKKKRDYYSVNIINGKEYAFEAPERPIFNAMFVPSTMNHYQSCVRFLSEYILREGKADILRILQSFDASIEDISVIGDDIYLFNAHSGSLPLFAYGLGLQKALLLSSLVVYCSNGVLLIDEVDNAIHISAFETVFRWFIEACEDYNVQAFITTHSAEAIDAIINSKGGKLAETDNVRVITMRRDAKNHITRYKMRNREEALEDREQFGMELRV